MAKIYERTPQYKIGHWYVTRTFRRYYRKITILGKENIPSEGPVIFGPNHLNALMDALMVLSTTPKKLSNSFLARSDIFKSKIAARILRYLKIMPAFRMRDGMENLNKNNETFSEADEVLDTNNALCLMPEGSQGDQRKLRPLQKGIFRVAFTAQEKYGTEPGIIIIPVGIDYSDRVKFGADVVINYGKPIQVSDYMERYKENPAVAINELRAYFKDRLHEVVIDLATENYYDCFALTVEVANTAATKQLGLKNDEGGRFIARQKVGEYLVDMEKNEPERMEKLDSIYKEYKKLTDKIKLPVSVLEKPWNVCKLLLGFLLLLATSPIFAVGFVLNMFPFFMPGILRKGMGIKYDGFFSSFQYVFGAILTFPLFYLIQTILFAIFSPTPWWVVPIFAVGQYVVGRFSFYWYKCTETFVQNIRYRWLKMSKKKEMKKEEELRKEIISFIHL